MKRKYKQQAKTRSDLLTLLSEASEIEHGLACSYLYTAFSLRDEGIDDGISWEQLHKIKKWAGQIYFVASEEMLHLAQVWNLTSAIGGMPYYLRPNFPLGAKYYHFDLPISLSPFSKRVLELFKMYELPQEMSERDYVKKTFELNFEDSYDYKTVGELYNMIAEGFKNIPEKELFIGDSHLQVDSTMIDFPDIVKVTDKNSALEAIELIIEQGEGTPSDENNSHYYIFSDILNEFDLELKQNPDFNPSHNIIENPVIPFKSHLSDLKGNPLSNSISIQVADLFDDLYVLMMQTIQFSFFSSEKSASSKFSRFAIDLMPTVIKPLGELLMELPAGDDYDNLNAGPCFTMTRHISYPNDFTVAKKIFEERFSMIVERAHSMTTLKKMSFIAENLKDLQNTFEYV